MGEYLAGEGHTVLGIRLAGHATCMQDMVRTRWPDWVASVEDGWHILNGAAQRVFVIGLSMGGVLALLFASRYPVAGVIAMSTPFALPDDPRLPFIKLLSWFQPRTQKGPPDWQDPEAAREHVSYADYPTRSIAELRDLLAAMRLALPAVTAPALLMHSRQDGGVDPTDMERIHAALGSQDKRMLWLDNCGHVITREPERQRVFEAAARFIRQMSA